MSAGLSGYQLYAKFYRLDATATTEPDSMASLPLANVDWSLAQEYINWERVRRHPRLPIVLDQPAAEFEPSWDAHRGRPFLVGIRARFGDVPEPFEPISLPLSFLHDAARNAAEQLVESGQLVTGDRCRFRICAMPDEQQQQPGPGAGPQGLEIEPIAEPLQVQEDCISSLLERATLADEHPEQGLPAFLPAGVLEEMKQLTREAADRETGGVLIGHVGFDSSIPELFLRVTAQIPAVHAEQEATSLTLTPRTWAAAAAAVELRGLGETYLGWWHSHPDWCADCPEAKRRECSLRCDFFSAQDKSVHRCCFSRAFQVAMVISDHGGGELSAAMYGWSQGAIERRRFYLTEDD